MPKRGRKKKRTHILEEEEKRPHTFVVNKGNIGKSGSYLMMNIRKCLEPLTAKNLRARKYNKLKDYVHVSAQFNVTHILLLSRSILGYINLRICKAPRGPTLSFRVDSYLLLKDLLDKIKRPKVSQNLYESEPLLIMNGFDESKPHHKLLTTTFQNMLPAVNVKTVVLNKMKRCLLLNYNEESNKISLRHYSISASPVGVNRAVKKLLKKVPDLSKYSDISEFLTDGYFSESDGEDGPESQVVLPQKLAGRGNLKSNRSVIRLTELGPRVELQLVKIEDGLGDGEVLYHSYVQKTAAEKKELRERVEKKRKLKEKRKKEQQKNVERKKKELKNGNKSILKNKFANEHNSDVDDDEQYYKDEVGETPAPELMLRSDKKRKRAQNYKRDRDASAKRVHFSETDKSPSAGKPTKQPPKNSQPPKKVMFSHQKRSNVKGIAFRRKQK